MLLFDCDLRSSKQIGEVYTDQTGAYRIGYEASELLDSRTAADLRVEVQDAEGKTLLSSPIVFNAPRQDTIDLALGGPAHAQPSEFTSRQPTAVTPLLGDSAPPSSKKATSTTTSASSPARPGSRANASATGRSPRGWPRRPSCPPNSSTGCSAPACPATRTSWCSPSSTEGVDLQANAERLLEGVLATSAATSARRSRARSPANLIPASYAERSAADFRSSRSSPPTRRSTSTEGFGKTSIAQRPGRALRRDGRPGTLHRALRERHGTARANFWTDLGKERGPSPTPSRDAALRRADRPADARLRAADRGARRPAHRRPDRERARPRAPHGRAVARAARKGAGQRRADRRALLHHAQTPELARETYATMLERFFTRTYPTTAFSARVAADEKTPFGAAAATAEFLNANPALDLRYTNIDAYAAKTQLAPKSARRCWWLSGWSRSTRITPS